MKVIENLEVRNYRGIKNISFKSNSVNILVGRNNTGKSALLESIAFILSFNKKFKDSIGNDLLDYITEKYEESYLVNINGKTAEIKAEIKDKEYTISIEYYSDGLPQDERLNYIIEYFENLINRWYRNYIEKEERYTENITNDVINTFFNELKNINLKLKQSDLKILENNIKNRLLRKKIFRTMDRYIESEIQTELDKVKSQTQKDIYNLPKLIITAYENSQIVGLYILFAESLDLIEKFENIRSKKVITLFSFLSKYKYFEIDDEYEIIPFKGDLKHIPLLFDFERVTYDIEDLHDSVVETGKIRRAVDLLKERDIIDDIRKTERGLMVFPKQYDEPLPLSSMGDGFLALLKIIFLIAIAERGVILIEEPEVSLHPGYLDIIAEEIVLNSDKVQFFISTHSFDLIQAILEKAEKYKKLDEINIVRLHYREAANQIYPEVLDGEMAKEEIDEIGTDLRQT